MSTIIKIKDNVSVRLNKNFGICDYFIDSDEMRSKLLNSTRGRDLRLESTQSLIENILNPVSRL